MKQNQHQSILTILLTIMYSSSNFYKLFLQNSPHRNLLSMFELFRFMKHPIIPIIVVIFDS